MNPLCQPLYATGTRPILVFAFGGRGEGRAWENRLRELDVSFVHFSDASCRWYLDGADGVHRFEAVAQLCKEAAQAQPGYRLASLGQSFGGYAALRLGTLMKLDAAIAFAPQTHVVRHRRIYSSQREFGPPEDITDIRPLVTTGQTPLSIHLSRSERENEPSAYFWDDHSHLDGLHGYPHIDIEIHDFHSHPTALHIARAGELSQLLDRELARERRPFAESERAPLNRN